MSDIDELETIWDVKKKGKAYVLTSWLGQSSVAEVPECIGKSKVEIIGERAFSPTGDSPNSEVRKSQLEEVRLPEGVRTIGRACFMRCESLRRVTLPNGLHIIGKNAFTGCSSLKSIELPESAWAIDNEAFDGLRLSTLTIRAKDYAYIGSQWDFSVDECRFCDTEVCDAFFDSNIKAAAKRVCLPSSMPEAEREEYFAKKNDLFDKMKRNKEKYGYDITVPSVEFGVWDDSVTGIPASRNAEESRSGSSDDKNSAGLEPLVAEWLKRVRIKPDIRKAITTGVALADGQGTCAPEALQLVVSLCEVPRRVAPLQCYSGGYETLDYLEPRNCGNLRLPSGKEVEDRSVDAMYHGGEWRRLVKPATAGFALAEITSYLDPEELSAFLEELYFDKRLDAALVALCRYGNGSAITRLLETISDWENSSVDSELRDYQIAESALQHSRTKEAKRRYGYL
ncbi:leucine-rich repeat domain-containing protein [Olsenella intestinalis]|uniref:leucine-rich repeat domain-containing protein n=1 Tax=Olsenella intestinalis TaxID=2930083 RepID=UPI00200C16B3|nr:leucine-rich repeat domain-containing protein [Olsenella intestinalis]